jgi:hypothetical protein
MALIQQQPAQPRNPRSLRVRQEAKPYVHQPFPSCRYHPDGRVLEVKSEDEDIALTAEDARWAHTPYPAVAVVPPPAPPSIDEVQAENTELRKLVAFLTEAQERLGARFDTNERIMAAQLTAIRDLQHENARLEEALTVPHSPAESMQDPQIQQQVAEPVEVPKPTVKPPKQKA